MNIHHFRRQELWLMLLILLVVGIGVYFFRPEYPEVALPQSVTIGEKSWELIGIAQDTEARTRGLSHRETLSPATGLLFIFPEPGRYSFWMKDMRFPIDIIFIRNGEVDSVAENRAPGDLTPVFPEGDITRVLEVNAGEGQGVEAGQRVIFWP